MECNDLDLNRAQWQVLERSSMNLRDPYKLETSQLVKQLWTFQERSCTMRLVCFPFLLCSIFCSVLISLSVLHSSFLRFHTFFRLKIILPKYVSYIKEDVAVWAVQSRGLEKSCSNNQAQYFHSESTGP